MRAVIYARYSTELQREASIEDQVRVCRRLIEGRGWTAGQVYSDMGMSGSSHLRPGYQKLLEDVRGRAFDVVVAESIDRISRDQEHIAAFHKTMSFAGIPVVTVAEGAINELHIGLKGTMSALYLKDLAQKTHRGLEGRVHAGKSAGGLSYGYHIDRQLLPNGSFTTGERQITPAEAAVVARIFREYAAGASARAIAQRLNAEGILGPRGEAWGFSTISGNWRRGTGVLNNELYIGKLVWNRQRFVKDPVSQKRQARPNPPEDWIVEEVPDLRIIDQALWERVKVRQGAIRETMLQAEGNARPEEARRARYLLSGLISCGCCGGGYVLVGKRRYGCANMRNKGTCSNRRTIDREALETRVLEGLKDHLLQPDLIAEFATEYQREFNRLHAAGRASRAAAERELAMVRKRIDQIVDAVCEGLYHPSMKAKLTDLEARKSALEAELETPEERPVPLHPGLVQVWQRKVAHLTEALNADATRAEAAEILRGLIETIRLIPEGNGLAIELVGELAGLLSLGANANAREGIAGVRQITMVAGAGFEPAAFRL